MDIRIRNKREISCQIFVKVLERNRRVIPLFQAVVQMKEQQISGLKTAKICNSSTFLSQTSDIHHFRFTTAQSIFYNFKCLNGSEEYTVQCKIQRLSKFCKPRKPYAFYCQN